MTCETTFISPRTNIDWMNENPYNYTPINYYKRTNKTAKRLCLDFIINQNLTKSYCLATAYKNTYMYVYFTTNIILCFIYIHLYCLCLVVGMNFNVLLHHF